jgi:hypothetical protein
VANNLRLSDLPTELLVKIFSYLGAPSLMQAQQTCALFDRIIRDYDEVWQGACYPYQPNNHTWRDLCKGLHDPVLLLSQRIRAVDALLIAEEGSKRPLLREVERSWWTPGAILLACSIFVIDIAAQGAVTGFGYRPSWAGAGILGSTVANGWWSQRQAAGVHNRLVQAEAELNQLAQMRAGDRETNHRALICYLRNLLDDLVSRDRIGRFYLSENHHLPHYGGFVRGLGQQDAQPNAIVENSEGGFFSFYCWTPELEGEKGSLEKVVDGRSEEPPPVIRCYRADYAILQRKLYLLTLAVPEDQLVSTELQRARKVLESELQKQALDLYSAAKEQIYQFTVGYCDDIRRKIENKLYTQLNKAKSGKELVAFTPLLSLSQRVKKRIDIVEKRIDAGRRFFPTAMAAVMAQDVIATSYACCISGHVAQEGANWVEDREGRLFDGDMLLEEAKKRNATSTDVVTINQEQEAEEGSSALSLTHRPSLSFRFSDLNSDIAGLEAEQVKEITLIPAHRAVFALLCRKKLLLDEGALDEAMLEEKVLEAKGTLLAEIAEQVEASWNIANRQIDDTVDCLPASIRPIERRRARLHLRGELERAARGDAPVAFTPLLGLEEYLRSTRD